MPSNGQLEPSCLIKYIALEPTLLPESAHTVTIARSSQKMMHESPHIKGSWCDAALTAFPGCQTCQQIDQSPIELTMLLSCTWCH